MKAISGKQFARLLEGGRADAYQRADTRQHPSQAWTSETPHENRRYQRHGAVNTPGAFLALPARTGCSRIALPYAPWRRSKPHQSPWQRTARSMPAVACCAGWTWPATPPPNRRCCTRASRHRHAAACNGYRGGNGNRRCDRSQPEPAGGRPQAKPPALKRACDIVDTLCAARHASRLHRQARFDLPQNC